MLYEVITSINYETIGQLDVDDAALVLARKGVYYRLYISQFRDQQDTAEPVPASPHAETRAQ